MRALTTIGITEKNQKKIKILKEKYKLKNRDDVLTLLFNLVKRYNLQQGLKEEANILWKQTNLYK